MVRDAKAAADVEELEFHAHAGEFLCDSYHDLCGLCKRHHVEDLRPDVAVDPDRLYVFASQRLPGCGRDLFVGDPELACRKAGGDLRVGRDFECRVDPERYLRDFPGSPCHHIELVEFVKGVERDFHAVLYGKGKISFCF